jgi:serine/threonine protein phosphatase 1
MRRLIISDIHGGYKALKQVFKKANVDYEKDRLICLGDTCDGWPEIKECFDGYWCKLYRTNNIDGY